jgi:hypothetical protein
VLGYLFHVRLLTLLTIILAPTKKTLQTKHRPIAMRQTSPYITLSSGSLHLIESSKYDIDNAVRCSRQPAGFKLEHDQVKSHEPTVLDGDEIFLEYGV